MANQTVYEYVVVLRGPEEDTIIIAPKTIMADSEKVVERLAIREVPADINIGKVEVFVRPFVRR